MENLWKRFYNTSEFGPSRLLRLLAIGTTYCYATYLCINITQTEKMALLKKDRTYQMLLTSILVDGRVDKLCGEGFYITSSKLYRKSSKKSIYKINYEGRDGSCSVIAKCDKICHEEMKNIMKKQLEYSKMTKEQKEMSDFKPTNFNNLILPTEQTYKKIEQILSDESMQHKPEQKKKYFTQDINLNIFANSYIRDEDTFYKFSNISIVDGWHIMKKENHNYSIEDTYYTNSTYFDILDKMDFLNKRVDLIDSQNKDQYLSKEIRDQKERYKVTLLFREFILNVTCLAVIGTLLFMSRTQRKVDYGLMNVVEQRIEQSQALNSAIGNNVLLYFTYKKHPPSVFKSMRGFIAGTNKNAKFFVPESPIEKDVKYILNHKIDVNILGSDKQNIKL